MTTGLFPVEILHHRHRENKKKSIRFMRKSPWSSKYSYRQNKTHNNHKNLTDSYYTINNNAIIQQSNGYQYESASQSQHHL